MTTAAYLIDRATALIGVRGLGQALPSDVQADIFESLRIMLDAWRLEGLLAPHGKIVFSTVGGQASYTISPTGNIVATTPGQITAMYVTSNARTIDLVPENAYDSIPDKTSQGTTYQAYFDNSQTIYLYPVPSSVFSITIKTPTPFPEFASVIADIDLGAGVESAIINNLAVLICPAFEKMPSPIVVTAASVGKRNIKRGNWEVQAVDCPVSGSFGGSHHNIVRGP